MFNKLLKKVSEKNIFEYIIQEYDVGPLQVESDVKQITNDLKSSPYLAYLFR